MRWANFFNMNSERTSFKRTVNVTEPDESTSEKEMAVEVPLISLVPIPVLKIDEVEINFDMEVKAGKNESE